MVKFNPEHKEKLRFEEVMLPALEIKTKEEATQYIEDYSEYLKDKIRNMPDYTKQVTPEIMAKVTIAYSANYKLDNPEEFMALFDYDAKTVSPSMFFYVGQQVAIVFFDAMEHL